MNTPESRNASRARGIRRMLQSYELSDAGHVEEAREARAEGFALIMASRDEEDQACAA